MIFQPDRVAGVFHFKQLRAFIRRMVRPVQNHHQLPVKSMEQHRMTAISGEQRPGLLLPRASEAAADVAYLCYYKK